MTVNSENRTEINGSMKEYETKMNAGVYGKQAEVNDGFERKKNDQ